MSSGGEFLFPTRIHRVSFLVRFVVCIIATQFLVAYVPLSPSVHSAPSVLVWLIAALLVGVYALFFVFLPRLRDAGLSEWWLLVALLPFANLLLASVLLFRASADSERNPGDADSFWT
jgi:uncharacterized membrane protein YhaH (DUF805 family)